MTRPDVLLLDAGNTLVFLDHDALALAARDAGVVVTGDALRRAEPIAKRAYETQMREGMSHEAGWLLHMQVIFETAGLSNEAAQQATAAAQRAHDDFNLWRKVPDGLPEALARAQQAGLRLGIISNSEGKLAALLTRVSLDGYFEHVIDSALEGVRKPDPEIFRRGLSRMNVAPERALYAGDIPRIDVDGARAVGMDAVLIDPLNHYPDYVDAPRWSSVVELLYSMGI